MDTLQMSEQTAIKAGIDAWINAVEVRDISLLPQVVTQDADLVWIGAARATGWPVSMRLSKLCWRKTPPYTIFISM